jgi:hypothetical protein
MLGTAGAVQAVTLVAAEVSYGVPRGEPLIVEPFGVLDNDTVDPDLFICWQEPAYTAKLTELGSALFRKVSKAPSGRRYGNRTRLRALAPRVCRNYTISLGELCSGSRRHSVVQARAALSWIAVRELGSGAEVARYLGVTNSCVTRIVASGNKPPVEELIDALGTFCTNVPLLFTNEQMRNARS